MEERHQDIHISAQQKFTIPTLAPPALLVTCHQLGLSLVSVTEWSVGEKSFFQIPSKHTNIILKKGKPHSNAYEYPSYRSCVKFGGNGTFIPLPVSMVEERTSHICWGLPSGEVLLLGGWSSPTTTERISTDGSSSSADFTLPYDTE